MSQHGPDPDPLGEEQQRLRSSESPEPIPVTPQGLSRRCRELLERHRDSAAASSTEALLADARVHLEEIRRAAGSNRFINLGLAELISERLHRVAAAWSELPQEAQPWLKGAIAYFSDSHDDLPDQSSPIGFDDDCEVLNACLELAGRSDLALDPETAVALPAQPVAPRPETPARAAFTPGMRVLCRDAEWLVTRVERADRQGKHVAVHCTGSDDLVRGHEAVFLSQLDSIEPVDPVRTRLVADTSSGFRLSRLFLEAQLRRMPATGPTPDLTGLGVFRPMQFQLQAVQLALAQLRPRLLLADAVGLGKTVEVGQILTELLRRGRADRILVLARKSMLTQLQAELWNRFAIPLVRLDSAGISRLRLRIPANKNPFEVFHRVIISIDTLKNVGRYRHFLESTRWDVVVIDEAHNVAGASVPERHLAHRLARLLARRSDSLLLTTATPHNGKRETFGRLISLLDPSAIPDPLLREYSADDIRGFFLMRFKEDVREEAGADLSDRQVAPLDRTRSPASAAEEQVYALLAELRAASAAAARAGEPWARHRLVQYGLYKAFLSSPEACLATTRSRLASIRDRERTPEHGFLERLQGLLEPMTLAGSTRYRLLRAQLDEIGWDGSPACPRLLLFTESRPTQDALVEALARDYGITYSSRFEDQPQQVLAVMHGSCPDIHLMRTVESFATGTSPLRLLVATDVASEGINLHHECHHILHYDLPWSIITLIQRNGRIDRFGQRHTPILRYLLVDTEQPGLSGDLEIFERLTVKVEEINRSTRPGEAVLKLYDPEAEERYIAEHGVLAGNQDVLEQPATGDEETAVSGEAGELEAVIAAANLAADADLLGYLLGDEPAPACEEPATETGAQRPRLLGDRQFLLEGYEYIAGRSHGYQPIEVDGPVMTVSPPPDLRRRLGAPDAGGDVIFGATAIPAEAWGDNGQLRLTDDPERVELAIAAARSSAGYWASELLCSEHHPVLQWVGERLLMLVERGTAPLITSPRLEPGELSFVLVGQVSSRAGTPLVVDAHAVCFYPGGRHRIEPITEAMQRIGFDSLVNTGAATTLTAAEALIPSAVAASLAHLRGLEEKRVEQMQGPLRREERRLRAWSRTRRRLLEERIASLGEHHHQSQRWQRELRVMEQFLRDRERNWRDAHLYAAPEPGTRLVLVVQGTS